MKNLLKLAIILTAILLISACKQSVDTPEEVAETFLNHITKKEYAEAKTYGTESTGKMIDLIESFTKMDGEELDEEIKEPVYEDIKAVIDGETAIVTYKADGLEEKINMVLQDGKWLVDMRKEDSSGDEIKQIQETEEEYENLVTEEDSVLLDEVAK